MAGTLTISTLSDGTNSTSATNCIKGSARAWCNYNGSTSTLVSSYNVSSVTKNGTGDYTINYTNAMPNANYTVAFGLTDWKTLGVNEPTGTYLLTTSVRVISRAPNTATLTDVTYIGVTVFTS